MPSVAGIDPSEVPVHVKLLEEQVDTLGEIVRDLIGAMGQTTAQAFANDQLALTAEERLERLREIDALLRGHLTRLEAAWESESEPE